MNFEFAEEINSSLENLDFESALKIAECKLNEISYTEFHEILKISILNQCHMLLNWIEEFYQLATQKFQVKALYFEMNEFDINTDIWYIDAFAYEKDGGLVDNMNWLSYFNTDSQEETNSVFEIKELDKLQIAFSRIDEKEENGEWSDEEQNSRDWCEQLILIHFMQLIGKTHLKAKEKNLKWGEIPIYFTEHAYNFIVKSN